MNLVPKEVADAAIKIGAFADELKLTVATYREIGQDIGGRIGSLFSRLERGIVAAAKAISDEREGR